MCSTFFFVNHHAASQNPAKMINVKCLSEKKHTSCWTISSKHENLLVWRWSRAPVSAEMIKLRRSAWLCRTDIGCTGKELCPSPRSTIHPPMPQCTYQDTYQHIYQPTRNLLAHPATHPSHLPIAQKKSLNTLNFKTNCGPWLEWQPSFVPCMDIHGFLCLPNRL